MIEEASSTADPWGSRAAGSGYMGPGVAERGNSADIRPSLRVPESGHVTRDLHEPLPATVTVEAVDRHGRPLRFASVTPRFGRGGVALREDGVQRLTHHTDVTGVCVLRGAPPRGLEVDVRWGGVSVTARRVADGRFRAVLPLPAAR